jgi:hypothetical protein
MIRNWAIIIGTRQSQTHGHMSGADLDTSAKALDRYFSDPKNAGVKRKNVIKTFETNPTVENYEELVDWLKTNKVSPAEAQGGAQVFVINSRSENIEPNPCPNKKCKADLNVVGTDNIGNAYYCKRCKTLIQVG